MSALVRAVCLFAVAAGSPADLTQEARDRMVDEQIVARGVQDPGVLAAMRKVRRDQLVPPEQAAYAYQDRALPIGFDQTISQPAVVAHMTELARVRRGQKVLEIGTGSGYQAAVLAELGAKVFTIEIVEPLGKRAAGDLARLGYQRVRSRIGDGYLGWPEAAPFDAIIVTAAPSKVPEPLKQQLKHGGRLVIPVGDYDVQRLLVITRTDEGFDQREIMPLMFVPMTGRAQQPQ